MVHMRHIAPFMMLLLTLVVLGDLTALASRGLTNSSSTTVSAHMSDDVTINESRAEDRISDAGGKEYCLGGRKMNGVKAAAATGDAEINSRSSSFGDSPSTEDLSDATLNGMSGGSEDIAAREGSGAQLLHGSGDHHTPQITPPKLAAAAAEVFNMMNKDYHSKARRRPPINNQIRPDHV